MLKKIICMLLMATMVFSFAGCARDWSKDFDLSDPKEYWEGTINDAFADDILTLEMRKTSTYPELKLSDFKLDNAKTVEYVSIRPKEDRMNDAEYIAGFRQLVFIHLDQHGKDKVVEAIRHLEKLEFIKSASPNGYGTTF